MTIALIADIHGNYEALSSVLAELDQRGIDTIHCLGDVAGYYSQVNECCDELRRRNIPTLLGNHDWYLGGDGFCPRSRSVNDCLAYQRKVITTENKNWLAGLPIHITVRELNMVHGGWADPIDEYLISPRQEYFEKLEGIYFCSGHTHMQGIYQYGRQTYCNPGSVGQPRDGDPRAAYALFDGGFSLHRTEYNRQKVYNLMDAAGFNDYYYGCLETGARNLCRLPVK